MKLKSLNLTNLTSHHARDVVSVNALRDALKNKKVGTIVVGGSPVDSIQYELIDKQFDCMAKYLSWNLLFQKSYYATAKDELSKNQDAMKELEDIGKEL